MFPLRNIHFRDIKALGFDMDYTLSHYRSPEIEELAYRSSARLLVSERGYPEWLLDTQFDPGFAIRGLVLDGTRGNLLKLDSSRQVVRACHGSRPHEPGEDRPGLRQAPGGGLRRRASAASTPCSRSPNATSTRCWWTAWMTA